MDITKTIRYPYDYINPHKEDNPKWDFVPSFRGENQLNIYTYDYDLKTNKNGTGVNPWGSEAAVNDKGYVIDINDRVTIPNKGFVLSGNSKANKFITKNIKIGSKVTLDLNNKEIIVETNEILCLFATLQKKEKDIKKRYKKAIENAYRMDLKRINNLFFRLKENKKIIKKYLKVENINSKQFQKYNSLINKSIKILDNIYLLTSPSYAICSRNIWARPHEKNLNEIIETLEFCKSMNINGIYIESFYNGDIPGISNITETNEEVKDGFYGEIYKNDYLKALINEAHKRNIEIHAWVECFFVGEKSSQWKNRYKDSWHMINYDGSTIQGNNDEHNEMDFIWLDPANPECLDYVLSIYEELLTKYDFDGINVDYVRYPHGNLNRYSSNGYTDYAINEFKEMHNLTGDIKDLINNPEIYQLWVQYRVNKITTLMKETRKLVDRVKPNCYISTAVCSDLNYAIQNKMQNWKVWARNGWLDLTLPMAYYTGTSEIAVATKELVDFNKEKAFSYTGIMCMMPELPGDLVTQQINTLLDNHADGYALFHLGDLIKRKDCQNALRKSVNRYPSIHPHSETDKILKAFIKDLKTRRKYFVIDISQTIKKLEAIQDFSINYVVETMTNIYKTTNNKILRREIRKIIHFLNIKKRITKNTV